MQQSTASFSLLFLSCIIATARYTTLQQKGLGAPQTFVAHSMAILPASAGAAVRAHVPSTTTISWVVPDDPTLTAKLNSAARGMGQLMVFDSIAPPLRTLCPACRGPRPTSLQWTKSTYSTCGYLQSPGRCFACTTLRRTSWWTT